MLDKYLKIFGLDNNFSLDELDGKYKELLKEFDTKNIEDDLKVIFLEEQVKIREAYQILLKYYYKQEKVDQIKSVEKRALRKPSIQDIKRKRKKNNYYIIIVSCFLLLSGILGVVFEDNIKKLWKEKTLIGFKIKTVIEDYPNGIAYERRLLANGAFDSYRFDSFETNGEYMAGEPNDRWWVENGKLYIYYNEYITYTFLLTNNLTQGTWKNMAPDNGTCEVLEYSEDILYYYLK